MPIHTILDRLSALGFCKIRREQHALPPFHKGKRPALSFNRGKKTKRVVFPAVQNKFLGKQEYYPTSKRGWTSLSDQVIRQRFSCLVCEIESCYQRKSNRNQMGRIRYLLFSSMLKTLAHRHKTNRPYSCKASPLQ